MKQVAYRLITWLFKLIGSSQCKQLVYFESFHGKQYSDNPKAIYLYMKQYFPDYRLIWGVNRGAEAVFLAENVEFVYRFSWHWFLTMPRACFWVINTRTPLWLYKPKHVTYVQTWHGVPLKKIGCDIKRVQIPGYTTENYRQEVAQEAKRWDLLIAPNHYTKMIFQSAFASPKKIITTGYPRNDQLINPHNDQIQRIKENLAIPQWKKVILYAPTWREDSKTVDGQYTFSSSLSLDDLSRVIDGQAILLTRLHYLVADQLDIAHLPNVIDVSYNIDMSDLLLISDLLITDYSSSFFDFSLLQRPMLFFIPDQIQYTEELRGCYDDLDKMMPGPKFFCQADLEKNIRLFLAGQLTFDKVAYQYLLEKKMVPEATCASRLVVEHMFDNQSNLESKERQ